MSTPTPDVDQLADHLASTSNQISQNGQWTYFPPGTTIDEQLLILAGVEDYDLSSTSFQTFSPDEMQCHGGFAANTVSQAGTSQHNGAARQGHGTFAQTNTPQIGMDQHLTTLRDAELATMLHDSLQLDTRSQSQHLTPLTPPSSPPRQYFPPSAPTRPSRQPHFTHLSSPAPPEYTPLSSSAPPTYTPLPPISSCPPGSLSALKSWYLSALLNATEPYALLHAPLPCDSDELEDLSCFMAQHVGAMVECGRSVVFSPAAHPWHPMWVSWQSVGDDIRVWEEEGGWN